MELWKSFKAKVDEEDDTEDDIKSAFKTYDIDGDGYITKDEMVTVQIPIFLNQLSLSLPLYLCLSVSLCLSLSLSLESLFLGFLKEDLFYFL